MIDKIFIDWLDASSFSQKQNLQYVQPKFTLQLVGAYCIVTPNAGKLYGVCDSVL